MSVGETNESELAEWKTTRLQEPKRACGLPALPPIRLFMTNMGGRCGIMAPGSYYDVGSVSPSEVGAQRAFTCPLPKRSQSVRGLNGLPGLVSGLLNRTQPTGCSRVARMHVAAHCRRVKCLGSKALGGYHGDKLLCRCDGSRLARPIRLTSCTFSVTVLMSNAEHQLRWQRTTVVLSQYSSMLQEAEQSLTKL